MPRRSLGIAALSVLALTTLPAVEPPARSGKTEQAEVHLVLIDAVVTGEGDRPVHGLTKESFALQIDGRNAPVAYFEDHCPAGPPAPDAVPAIAAAGTPPAEEPASGRAVSPVPAIGAPAPRLIVLYFDLPHLSPPGAARSVRAARRYLESAGVEGNRFMVVAFGPDVRILTPFTGDADRIAAALERVTERGVTYDEGPVARSNKVQEVTHETCPDSGNIRKCDNQILLASELAREEETIARKSLEALRATMVALAGVSGRKGFVFFTETLRDEPGVYYLEIAKTTPRGEQISIDNEFRAAVEEANAASVSFYPVYAAGLDDAPDSELGRSASSLGTKGERVDSPTVKALPRRAGPPGGTRQMKADVGPMADAERSAEAAAVGFNASIAAETGGRHLGRTNDLSLIFPIVREEMSCYYVLSYAPPPPADGRKHLISVGVDRKGLKVRSRQYFMDWAPEERSERRLKTALAAPGAFRDLGVTIDAFALGRSKEGRQVLVKASVPAADLARSSSGIPPDDGAASVSLRGRVATERNEVCTFSSDFPVAEVAAAAAGKGTLQYEAECSLPAGPYEISAAVMERRGGALGGARREIGVASLSGFQISDPQLWTSSPADLVHREQAAGIFGATKGIVRGAASPRAERRLMPGQKGSLLFLVCPAEKKRGTEGASQVTVTRVILSGETPVATFPPLKLAGEPDPGSGCWGINSEIPSGILGEGIYTFNYEVHAPGLAEPAARSAAFAVGGADPPTAPAGGGAPPSP